MEPLPDFLFDLLAEKEFHQLSDAERTSVLACMDEPSYTSLRMASVMSRKILADDKPPLLNPNQLQQLLKKAEAKHLSQQTIVWNKPIPLWKAAAVFILLGGGWMVLRLASQHPVIRASYITQLDTVYIEKEIPAEKIHDTVFIEYKHVYPKRHAETTLPSENYSPRNSDSDIPVAGEVNIVGVKAKDDPINNKKGNSIKDDSLIHAFGFVTL